MTNTERISRALDLLRDGLGPKCAATWQGVYGPKWLEEVNRRLHSPAHSPTVNDVAFLFKGMKGTWNEVFSHGFTPVVRALVFEFGGGSQQLGAPGEVLQRRHRSCAGFDGAGARGVRRHRRAAQDPGPAPRADAADVRGGVPRRAAEDRGETHRGSTPGGLDAVAGDHHSTR